MAYFDMHFLFLSVVFIRFLSVAIVIIMITLVIRRLFMKSGHVTFLGALDTLHIAFSLKYYNIIRRGEEITVANT